MCALPYRYFLQKAEEIRQRMVKIRRDIHRYPETGFNETHTASRVCAELEKLGIEVRTGIARTGVVGVLRGIDVGRTILLRADMDCLEIEEHTDLEYISERPGLMHACGHDAHTAWVLGAAMILSELKDSFAGNVVFLFQPAEETTGGAADMIGLGVLDDPKVDAALAAHIDPSPWNRTGMIALKYGTMCAAADRFTLTITGPGGHVAYPHHTPDPLHAAVEVYHTLKSMVEREIDPLDPVILHVGNFHSGTSHNAIPDRAELTGSIRTLSGDTRDRVETRLRDIVNTVCGLWKVSCVLEYERGYPPVINNKGITDLVRSTAEEILGRDNVTVLEKPDMTGEDFAYFSQKVPATYINIGTYNPDIKAVYPLHSSQFVLDEASLAVAAAILAASAYHFLSD